MAGDIQVEVEWHPELPSILEEPDHLIATALTAMYLGPIGHLVTHLKFYCSDVHVCVLLTTTYINYTIHDYCSLKLVVLTILVNYAHL